MWYGGSSTPGNQVIATAAQIAAQPLDTWVRYSTVLTLTVIGSDQVSIGNFNGAATGTGWDSACAQLETGAFPTSYIPTTTAAATRAMDNAVISGTNFSSWYNPTEGTFVFKSAYGSTTTTPVSFSVNNSASSFMLIYNGRFASNNVVGVSQGDIFGAGSTPVNNAVHKIAFGYKANDSAITINGGAAGVSASWAIPTVDRLVLGSPALTQAQKLNGWIETLQYYALKKPNGELSTLSVV
jgi:hypothetical protein